MTAQEIADPEAAGHPAGLRDRQSTASSPAPVLITELSEALATALPGAPRRASSTARGKPRSLEAQHALGNGPRFAGVLPKPLVSTPAPCGAALRKGRNKERRRRPQGIIVRRENKGVQGTTRLGDVA